jgi:RNA polymerase sigma factor (sigma-70 family)
MRLPLPSPVPIVPEMPAGRTAIGTASQAVEAGVTVFYEAYHCLVRADLARQLAGGQMRDGREDVVDDLTQLTFIRLWHAMQRGVTFQTEAHVRGYLHTIVVNLVRDQWRHERLRTELSLPPFPLEEEVSWFVEPSTSDGQAARETLLLVAQVLLELHEADRTLLLAHAYGYPFATIAAHFASSIPGVKCRLARVRTALRERYDTEAGEEAPSQQGRRSSRG